jgi:hypothetical protein
MVKPPGEVESTYPTQVASTHGSAEVTSVQPVEMTIAKPAAATCKRIGRNASASHRHSGHDDRDFVQHKFLHGSFTFLLR